MPKHADKQKGKHEDQSKGGPRGMWSGTISFGLVSVPVSLFPALRSRPTHLRMLDEDGTPLRRQYVCSKEGKALDRDDLVRGYETDDGKMLVIEDAELESLAPEKTRDITLRQFVRIKDVPVFHYDRPYFLAPAGGSTKAYRLLARVMEEQQRAGIGSFIMREKEYLIAILAKEGLLMAETLRFADEIRTPEDVGLPVGKKVAAKEVKPFAASIKAMSQKKIDLDELRDVYADQLERLVGKKRKTKGAVVEIATGEEEDEPENTIDLVAIFKQRMREAEAAETSGGSSQRAVHHTSDLDQLTKEELYEQAKARNIPGRSKMSKEELMEALAA